jgi:alcohol dehydrogenase
MSSGFVSYARTTVVFGPGTLATLGSHAKSLGFSRPYLVADAGMVRAGYVARAQRILESEAISSLLFSNFSENPKSDEIERGKDFALHFAPDSIVALGGGSSLDCAKAINFLLAQGGRIQDYWGYDKATCPLLPMIGVPTTTGTGSEAQSYALISDAETHVKMAIGAPSAAFRMVILDPELAVSQPRSVLATAGYDAISHAVETAATTRRNLASIALAREAWCLLSANFERLLNDPWDIDAAGQMQYGAYLAGSAIEHSMLGAAHATANPLTATYGLTHGLAIALMLVPVVNMNGIECYSALDGFSVSRLESLAQSAGLPRRLRDLAVPLHDLEALAVAAAQQWTGRFNPRPFDVDVARRIYECAF